MWKRAQNLELRPGKGEGLALRRSGKFEEDLASGHTLLRQNISLTTHSCAPSSSILGPQDWLFQLLALLPSLFFYPTKPGCRVRVDGSAFQEGNMHILKGESAAKALQCLLITLALRK